MNHPMENQSEREFKPQIIGKTPELPKKSSKTRRSSTISGSQLNAIAYILDFLKILSEVIVAFKCGPLEKIEKQVMS